MKYKTEQRHLFEFDSKETKKLRAFIQKNPGEVEKKLYPSTQHGSFNMIDECIHLTVFGDLEKKQVAELKKFFNKIIK